MNLLNAVHHDADDGDNGSLFTDAASLLVGDLNRRAPSRAVSLFEGDSGGAKSIAPHGQIEQIERRFEVRLGLGIKPY